MIKYFELKKIVMRFLYILILLLPLNLFSQFSDSDNWFLDFAGTNGPAGKVYCVAEDGQGNIYVGGDFLTAGGISAKHIAVWNGNGWDNVGGGVDGPVYSLSFDNNGNLYVGGDFTVAGNVTVNNLAKWDGSNWYSMAGGMNNTVYTIATDGNGTVYAGGKFTSAGTTTLNYIAKWDGSDWVSVGTGFNSYVYVLKFDSDGNLYAGGSFTESSSNSMKRIAKWDNISWQSLGDGVNGTVRAIEFDNSSNVYIGGEFDYSGSQQLNHIGYWNGASWVQMGNGADGEVKTLLFYNNNLYVGGNYTTVNNHPIAYFSKWDGSDFLSVGDINKGVYALLNKDTNIILGGSFTLINGAPVSYIGLYTGTSFNNIGTTNNGLNDKGYAVAYDSVNNVAYFGGAFTSAGDTVVNCIVKWDGTDFYPLGEGFNGDVRAISLDQSGNVYVGGDFTRTGSLTVNHIAKWNGTGWESLSTGTDASVLSIYVDNSGNVYAGGEFTNSGGVNTSYFSKWNGSGWSAVGSFDGFVNSICGDKDGNIYVAGDFSIVDGVIVNHIAKYDGTSWTGLGNGLNNAVFTLVVDTNNYLYAGGQFTAGGSNTLKYVAKWDGSSWSALGTGADDYVYTLIVDRSNFLYAGGAFKNIGGVNANYISRWNGNEWEEITTGTDNTVRAVDVSYDGRMFLAGDFTMVNGHSSAFLAQYIFYPFIEIYGNNNQILNNDTSVSVDDNTFFGYVRSCDTIEIKSFVIYNAGNWPLYVDSFYIAGPDSIYYHYQNINEVIPIGDSLQFNITFGPADVGTKNAEAAISSDSRDNYLFNYSISAVSIDTLIPVVQLPSTVNLYFDSTGTAILSNQSAIISATDNCDIVDTILSQSIFDCSSSYTLSDSIVVSVVDINNNESHDTLLVIFNDTIVPQLEVLTNYDVFLDSSGIAILNPEDYVISAHDNCVTDTVLSTDTLNCSYLDSTYQLAVTLLDPFGNSQTKTVDVTVNDTIKPYFVLTDTTIAIDENGFAVFADSAFREFAIDNCSIQSILFTPDTLSCNEIGVDTITVTLTDYSGNTSQSVLYVNLTDTTPPQFTAYDTTVYLNENGEFNLSNINVVDSVFENCQVQDTVFIPPVLDCSNIGDNEVVVQLVDVNGNVSSRTIMINVVDTLPPVPVEDPLPDINVQCEINVSPPTATDNCGQVIYAETEDTLFYDVQGIYYINWQYRDSFNNVTHQVQRVVVHDDTPPMPDEDTLQEVVAYCNYEITELPTATDNCNGEILATTNDQTYYDMPGEYLVTWNYIDENANSTQQYQVFEIINEPPVVLTKNITVMLDVYGNATITPQDIDDGSYDDCSIVSMTIDKEKFGLSDTGDNVVTLTVTDNANNISSEQAIVTVNKYPDLGIPNFISPNGDGVNDVWYITGIDHLIGYKLFIYDQSSNLVFQSDNYRNTWDGTLNGELLPNGTYYYVFINSQNQDKISGYITLIK